MLIKQQALSTYLEKHPLPAIYILLGQDHFLLTEAANNIKQAWRKKDSEADETILHITGPSDWTLLNEKANSYSLFASNLLIDVRYEKQTLETAGKNFLDAYLKNINTSCLLLIRAPQLSMKQVQNFTNNNSVHVIQLFSLDASAMQHWIKEQLKQKGFSFATEIPSLIHQYTQGNMLACAQALEKISLVADDATLTEALVKEQLVNQCDYQLFELSEACLLKNSNRAIQHLRHANNSGTEPTLILWLLAQEIRLLIQLIELNEQSIPFATACSQLKIWSQRARLYQSALRSAKKEHLLRLLQFCKKTDERIKSSYNSQIWPSLEQIALSICLDKQVGAFA